MFPHYKLLSAISLCLLCLSCAPGLGKTLSTRRIDPDTTHPRIAGRLEGVIVRVGAFEDSRPSPAIGRINDREIFPEGNPGADVRSAFESAARGSGARLSQFEGVKVAGQILEWKADIKPAFPLTTIESRASIRLSISRDGETSETTPVYSGTFGGVVSSQLPYASQEKIEEELGESMAVAIAEALGNGRFQSELRGESAPRS